MKPSRIRITVNSEFRASHTLAGFEIPHFHLWKIAASYENALPMQSDRVVDLVFLQDQLNQVLASFSNVYLNESFSFSPTSENVAIHLWDELTQLLPDAPLFEVEVRLCDLNGTETGRAQVFK